MIQTVMKYFLLLSILFFAGISTVSANSLDHNYDNFHYVNSHQENMENLSYSTIKFSKHFSQDYPLYTTKKEQVKLEFLYFESESKNKFPVSIKKYVNTANYFTSYFHVNSSTFQNNSFVSSYLNEDKCSSNEHFYLLFLSIIV